MKRRDVLQGLGALGVASCVPQLAADPPTQADFSAPSRFRFDPMPFPFGVASGDPTPTSVILWTRLGGNRPLDPSGLAGLGAETIAVDWFLSTDEGMRGTVRKGRAIARRRNGYAVHVDVTALQPGTTYWYRFESKGQSSRIGRTRTPATAPEALRFGCVSCQDFNAFYGAFEVLAGEALDFVVHLGDTIYESALGVPAVDLAGYRGKHALFRGDPQARAAWAAHPFVVIWDDHEVADNYAGTDPLVRARRDAAYRAFYEHMPVRWPAGRQARDGSLRLYRDLRFGDLLQLNLLDLRQYRRPGHTLLSADQKVWLHGRLRSNAVWTCIASPVPMADHRSNPDTWAGYPRERSELLENVMRNAPGRVVVLSGDAHRSFVSQLSWPSAAEPDARPVAVEFCTPALSSKAPRREATNPDAGFAVNPVAPWVVYEDLGYRGYLLCDVTRQRWRATYRVLKDGASACMTTLASFEVHPGAETLRISSSGFVPFDC